MEKLNRRDLVELVAEKAHLSKKDAKAAIDASIDLIQNALLEGTEVNITNFGVLTPKTRKSRDGTDPKTHNRITIKGKKTVQFRLAKSFKEELN